MIYGVEAWDTPLVYVPPPVVNWMAVGGANNQSDPLVMTSLDGQVWTSRLTEAIATIGGGASSGITLTGVATNGSRWVAVGYGAANSIWTSDDDGLTWTARTTDPSTTNLNWGGVCWTGSLFVAVGIDFSGAGHAPVINTSPDGTTWTRRTADPTTNVQLNGVCGIDSSPSLVIAVGEVSSNSGPAIMTSADGGVTWTARTPAGSAFEPQKGVAIHHSTAAVSVGISATNAAQRSTDGTTWTGYGGAVPEFMAVAWNGYAFAAVGADSATELVPKVSTSPDGVTWTVRTSDPSSVTNGLEWFGIAARPSTREFVAVGFESDYNTPHMMYSSDDGASWVAKVSHPSSSCNPFAIAAKP